MAHSGLPGRHASRQSFRAARRRANVEDCTIVDGTGVGGADPIIFRLRLRAPTWPEDLKAGFCGRDRAGTNDLIGSDVPPERRGTPDCAGEAQTAIALRISAAVELSPIFGDGLKDQAAAVWA